MKKILFSLLSFQFLFTYVSINLLAQTNTPTSQPINLHPIFTNYELKKIKKKKIPKLKYFKKSVYRFENQAGDSYTLWDFNLSSKKNIAEKGAEYCILCEDKTYSIELEFIPFEQAKDSIPNFWTQGSFFYHFTSADPSGSGRIMLSKLPPKKSFFENFDFTLFPDPSVQIFLMDGYLFRLSSFSPCCTYEPSYHRSHSCPCQ